MSIINCRVKISLCEGPNALAITSQDSAISFICINVYGKKKKTGLSECRFDSSNLGSLTTKSWTHCLQIGTHVKNSENQTAKLCIKTLLYSTGTSTHLFNSL